MWEKLKFITLNYTELPFPKHKHITPQKYENKVLTLKPFNKDASMG